MRDAPRAAADLAAQRRAPLRSGAGGTGGTHPPTSTLPSVPPNSLDAIPEAEAVASSSAAGTPRNEYDDIVDASHSVALTTTDDPPYSTAGLFATLEAAAMPPDDTDVAAAAEAHRIASADRADRAVAALRARRHLADFGSDLSVTARGSVSLSTKDEQVHVAAASHNHVQCAAKYPLTKRALRAKCVGRKAHEPVDPADFGVLVTGARGK